MQGQISRYATSKRDERGRIVELWRYVVDLPPGPDGKRRQRRKSGFESKSAAERALRAFRADVDGGGYIEPAAITVEEQVNTWLRGRRRVEPTTLRGYRVALAHVTSHMGTVKMQVVAPAHVESLVLAMSEGERSLSPRTVALTLGLFKRVCREAVRDGVIRRNPAEHVEPPRAEHKEMNTWTPDELRTFAAAADGDRLAWAWRMSMAGLRRSEVLGLRWQDVNLDAGVVTINQARVMIHRDDAPARQRAGAYVKAPKTERGRRSLPLDAATVAVFRRYRAVVAAERLVWGAEYDVSHDLIAVDERGTPLRPEFYSDEFRRLSKRAGVRAIRLHDVRHTCATFLSARGLPPASVSAWLGHASPAFTLRVYVHAQDAGMHEARDLLAGVQPEVCDIL